MADVNSSMKRLWRVTEFLAWAAFFAIAVALLALRFWLLPDIERYREAIVAAASRAVGQPVSIGGVDADWLDLAWGEGSEGEDIAKAGPI